MPNRKREWNDGLGKQEHITWFSNPAQEGVDPTILYHWLGSEPLFPFPPRHGHMTDVVGEGRSFHPVDHYSLRSFLGPLQPFPRYPGVVGEFGHTADFPVPFPLGGQGSWLDWPWLPEFSPAVLSDFAVDAFNKFHDQVPTTVSIANFIYELKDMKGMIPSIDKKSIAKTASNNFLAFEFGVKPFISDIKAILNMSDAVDKRIQHLIAMNGKTSNLRFDRTLELSGPEMTFSRSLYNSTDPNQEGTGVFVRFVGTGGKAVVHIGAQLTQNLTDLSDAMSKMKALAASSGFNHPARVIWNAIPYSFVVDWFFHVGKLLDQITIQPFGGQYDLSNIGYSVKSQALFIAHQMHTNGTVPVDNVLGTVEAKRYIRRPGFPVSSLFLTDALLSPKQLALGLAMLEQRRR